MSVFLSNREKLVILFLISIAGVAFRLISSAFSLAELALSKNVEFLFFLTPYLVFMSIFIYLDLGDVGIAAFNFSKSAVLAYVVFRFVDEKNIRENQRFFYFCFLFSSVFLLTFIFERFCLYLLQK